MNFKEIADNYSKNKRSMMTDSVVRNQNHQRNFPTYHSQSLNIMFAEWHLLFPTQKQDIHCTSCRKAVVKFWETMVDEWIITEQTSTKKPNASKKKKTKAK
jgi:hypothetical protein|tara:strand:+ start:14784 stop:15086 length:303 start_codon:yes stop_codon:yes gene_type:complete